MNLAKKNGETSSANGMSRLAMKVLGTLALACSLNSGPGATITSSADTWTQPAESSVAAVEAPSPEDRGLGCDSTQETPCKDSWHRDYEGALSPRR